ncbi:hypothetical protein [Owenweeksia hongkongensis]|uniref:hypothetical protein n=1 Tax=Owenweeksia hongkongensis TaxID=253245 RepID=UPI003A8E1905
MSKHLTLFMICLFAGSSFGQKSLFKVVHDKPVVTLEARIGKYWNIQQPDDSLSPTQYDHLKAISQGIRYDFSALYHFGEYFEIGLTFSGLTTSHTVEDVNILVVDPQGDTLNLYGDLVEGVNQSFFGPRLDARIKLGSFMYLRPGISVGYLNYENKTNAAGYKYALKGGTLGVDIHASLQYKADDNWGIMIAASIMPTFIYEPTVEFENGGSLVYTGGLLNVGHYHVGAGISYTFTKKNKDAMPAYF